MILQIPPGMPDEHYRPFVNGIFSLDGFLNLIFFFVFAILLFIFGVIFITQAKRQEHESVKRIKLSFGLSALGLGICRIIFILMFQDFTNPGQNYDLMANIAYSFGVIGFTSLIWALEKAKYETKYFFIMGLVISAITISGVVLMLIGLVEVREIILTIQVLGLPIAGFFIFILYIQLIRSSSGIVKKKSIMSFLGFLIMLAGMLLDGQFFLSIEEIPLWFRMDIVPIICIGGLLLFTIPQL